ncbi:hypothetical protein PO909_017674 [Leuciscus waleckii]
MSYLCLGKVPEMERLIRERALETQLLFGSSEALLLKCVGTSENLVTSLLPSLKVAAEKNKPQLALKFLEKSKKWISDIIIDVKDILKRYDKHNSDVTSSTSDIITVRKEIEEKLQQQTSKMKALQKIIDGLEANLLNISKEIEDYEKKIDKKNSEIHEFFIRITSNKEEKTTGPSVDFTAYSMMVPFVESVIRFVSKKITSTTENYQMMALHADLSEITEAQNRLKEQEWDIQNQLMDHQLKMAKLEIENDIDKVQKCLSRIQQNLAQLQKFWEKVGSMLDIMKERTFAGEIWVEDLTDMKEEFLESIDAAQEEWIKFGINSYKAYKIFSVQAIEAYMFLEISPSSLSEEEWEKEYESVKEKLQKIRPNTTSPAAITP